MGVKFQDSTALNQITFNSSSTTSSAVTAYAWGYCVALITWQKSGSPTTGAITVEGYDGYNWYALPNTAGTASATVQATATITTSGYAFANINGFSQVRARLSTTIDTGSVLVTINNSAATLGKP